MRTRRERGDTGRAIVAWLGAGCVSGASALVAGTIPPGSAGGQRERERVGESPAGRLLAWAGTGLRVSPFGGGCVSGGDDFPR